MSGFGTRKGIPSGYPKKMLNGWKTHEKNRRRLAKTEKSGLLRTDWRGNEDNSSIKSHLSSVQDLYECLCVGFVNFQHCSVMLKRFTDSSSEEGFTIKEKDSLSLKPFVCLLGSFLVQMTSFLDYVGVMKTKVWTIGK